MPSTNSYHFPHYLQRDLAEPNPLDGREGAIGVEHLEVQERVKELQQVSRKQAA
jgi:hypothetical protein